MIYLTKWCITDVDIICCRSFSSMIWSNVSDMSTSSDCVKFNTGRTVGLYSALASIQEGTKTWTFMKSTLWLVIFLFTVPFNISNTLIRYQVSIQRVIIKKHFTILLSQRTRFWLVKLHSIPSKKSSQKNIFVVSSRNWKLQRKTNSFTTFTNLNTPSRPGRDFSFCSKLIFFSTSGPDDFLTRLDR